MSPSPRLSLRAASLDATHAIAAALAGLSRAGDVILLAGEMGAGKTAFAQGFGRALGVTEPITSPTFTLVHSYDTAGPTLHHADVYRLDQLAEVADLALGELAEFDGIVLVEWGDVAGSAFGDHLEVRLNHVDDLDGDDHDDDDHDETAGDEHEEAVSDDEFADDGSREIELRAVGTSWAGRWDRITRGVERFRC